MKIQDLGFFVILGILIWLRKPRVAVVAGLISLMMAIPLFHFWVFFTAKRLTWYAGAFFLLGIFLNLIQEGPTLKGRTL